MRRSNARKIRGFTLLELLVAISIFAVVSAIAYAGLIQILQSRNQVEAERAFWSAFALTFRQLEDDLGQVRRRTVRDATGDVQLPALVGQAMDIRALGAPSLELTRGGVPVIGDSARSDMQRVAYRVVDGTLMRLRWPGLDRATTSEPVQTALIGGVEDFVLRFYVGKGQWTARWPLQQQGQPGSVAQDTVPQGVEVTIKFKDRGDFVRTFRVTDDAVDAPASP